MYIYIQILRHKRRKGWLVILNMLRRQELVLRMQYARWVITHNPGGMFLLDNWKGTPDFMPVEISRQRYLFAKLSKDTAEGKGLVDYKQRHVDKRKNPRTDDTPEGIYYNYIHDLESVWWIAVWTLFNFEKKDSGTDEINSCATKQSRLNNDKLFSRTSPKTDRSDFL